MDTALARIWCRASSLASDLVRPTVADRAVAVTSSPDSPTRPESPSRLTMDPPSRSAIRRATACVARSMPVTVTSTCACQSAGADSRNRWRRVAAALLTRIDTGPSVSSAWETAVSTAASSRRSARTAMALPPPAPTSAAAFSAPSAEEL
jgi:hypothetical protein